MKRMLLAGALALAASGQALAADLPPAAAPPPRAPAAYVPAPSYFSWTGIYVGLNGGFEFGQSNWNNLGVSTGNFNTNGFLVGGTLGGNYQIGSFVIGLEGDGDWSNANGNTTVTCGAFTCTTKSDWLATVRGRAGYAWDRVLVYGTGGVAFGDLEAAVGAFPFATSTQVGWTAGAGVEWAFTPNWTAKVEYLYVNLGNFSCPAVSCGGFAGTPTTVSLTENVVRAGVNYKFW